MSSRYQVSCALLAICFGSCGDGPAITDDAAAVDGVPRPVCGEDGIGLVFRVTGGMQDLELYRGLGLEYAVIDPSCRFALADTTPQYLGAAVEGKLTDDQAAEVSEFLGLEEWDDFDPLFGRSGCDGPSVRYAIGDRVFDIIPFCFGSPIPGPTDDFSQATGRLREVLSRLRTLGKPASGPVRYVLYRTQSTAPRYDGAPTWPLAVSVDVASMTTEGEDFLPEPVTQVARGEDADRLRSLRTAFLNGEIAHGLGGPAIPIAEPDGSHFDLYVRDVVEFENSEGKAFVPWVDLHRPTAAIP